MILGLDARSRMVQLLLIDGKRVVKQRTHLAGAGRIFGTVEAFMRRHRLRPGKGMTLAVVVGPGTFSTLRTAAVIANALAFAADIRLAGVRARNETEELSVDAYRKAARKTVSRLSPEYGRPPSITLRRS